MSQAAPPVFEAAHGQLFTNFTYFLNILRVYNGAAFDRYEDAVILESNRRKELGLYPTYPWSLDGPIIMGTAESIREQCREHAQVIERLLPIVDQAIAAA